MTIEHPLDVGARAYHTAQQWGYRYPEGTAVVLSREERPPGHWEYRVRTGRDFSRPPGPDNPEDRETFWPGWALRPVSEGTRRRFDEIMARVNAMTPQERAAMARRTEEDLAAWEAGAEGRVPYEAAIREAEDNLRRQAEVNPDTP